MKVQLSTLLPKYFSRRLVEQRAVSSHTIAAYRDTFRLLFRFIQETYQKAPSQLTLEDLDASVIGAFLSYLETQRGNGPRTRNARLAAIHSFFRYVAYEAPDHANITQRVLAIPCKRFNRTVVDYLSEVEVEALLEAPDRSVLLGLRDHTMLALLVQTGLRVSEMRQVKRCEVVLGNGAHIRCMGKGRKERCIPLTKSMCRDLQNWMGSTDAGPQEPLFPNARGGFFSSDGVQHVIAKHYSKALESCPSLKGKRVTPHVFRHTTAMNMLMAGVDTSVIALWLGHESIQTTQIYLQADLKLKEQALSKATFPKGKTKRFQANDRLLEFLEQL